MSEFKDIVIDAVGLTTNKCIVAITLVGAGILLMTPRNTPIREKCLITLKDFWNKSVMANEENEVEAEDAETEQNQTKEQPEKKAKNSAKAKFMRASSVDKFNMSISRFTSEDPDQGKRRNSRIVHDDISSTYIDTRINDEMDEPKATGEEIFDKDLTHTILEKRNW